MAEQKATNVHWHEGDITREHRAKILGHKGATLWFTGLSGSGKSTVAVELEGTLQEMGVLLLSPRRRQRAHGHQQEPGFQRRGPHREHPPYRRGGQAVCRQWRDRPEQLYQPLQGRPGPGPRPA